MSNSQISRRTLLRALGVGTALVASGPLLSACGGSGGETAADAVGTSLDDIIAKAKEEGKLQLMAYEDSWANFLGHRTKFNEKYGIEISVDSPDASSAEELQAVQNLKGQPSQPDCLDIGYSFTKPAMDQGLLEAYKPSNFDSIPDQLKDPDGYWIGGYYGVISVGVNLDQAEVPTKFSDLLDPKYHGKVAMPGDPRSGASSIATVFAAALANGGSLDDIGPGIDYFAELSKSGNLVVINEPAAALATGQAAVIFDWNYNWLGRAEQLKKDGVNFDYFVMEDGVFGNHYAQPVTIGCPHPNAARLWVDWLTSDEGAEQYALGGAIPARFTELVAAGKLSDEAQAALPDPEIVKQVSFPTTAQGDAANKAIATQWTQKVS